MRYLELLAPARNADIGIAAVDCGADAVYIAADEFGARKDAGNSIEEIARLCEYAHLFGVRIFLTVNTIVYDAELEKVHSMMLSAQAAGVDAFIVQDTAVMQWDDITLPLHASTQCAIRNPEDARFYESLGCSRLVLERELSLEQIRDIRAAVSCELEFFVHGALCVCYSGNCYMSQAIAGRSANRGACIQACRSLYDLEDSSGKILQRNRPLLSLKDYCLSGRLGDLTSAGIDSFKIEGRLKNASYVKNAVRKYSQELDALVAEHPQEYARASFGCVRGGFAPDLAKTFNRGYTALYIDGKRSSWASMSTAKSVGEPVGHVMSIENLGERGLEITLKSENNSLVLNNGDGFCFAFRGNAIGFRADVCDGYRIYCKPVPELAKGTLLYRNINAAFERELDKNLCHREIRVEISLKVSGNYTLDFTARSEDGREVFCPFKVDSDTAENRERQLALIEGQLSKRSSVYSFSVANIEVDTVASKLPLLSASTLNSIRRLIAEDLDRIPCGRRLMETGRCDNSVAPVRCDYRANVSNASAAALYRDRGAADVQPAFELEAVPTAELMRTRYCIRYELGLCPVHHKVPDSGPLFLRNNGRRFALGFDCRHCEMTVSEKNC